MGGLGLLFEFVDEVIGVLVWEWCLGMNFSGSSSGSLAL